MSNSKQSGTTGASGDAASAPRAVIHKQILDVAAANPTSSIDELATEVSAASPDLVERVLDEYGDPGDETSSDASESDDVDNASDATDPDESSATVANAGPAEDEDAAADDEDAATEDEVASSGGTEDDATESADAVDSPAESAAAETDASETRDSNAPTETTEPPAASGDERDTATDLSDLDETDRALLSAVAERPDATQQAIADALGVSRATISRRVSDIAGLEWRNRAAFVDDLIGETEPVEVPTAGSGSPERRATVAMSTPDADVQANRASSKVTVSDSDEAEADGRTVDRDDADGPTDGVAALANRVATIETRLDDIARGDESENDVEVTDSDSDSGEAVFDDPELVHKVVHACLESDRISEDEELRILASVLDGDRTA